MRRIEFTLITDGGSDRVLTHIIEWVIQEHSDSPVLGRIAASLPSASQGLKARIARALQLYPCDLLFVHRDAEAQNPALRFAEIDSACDGIFSRRVPVVPVRMTEAWLLGREDAIRGAAENKNGRVPLDLPARKKWEELPDPKHVLYSKLKLASELPSRRAEKVRVGAWAARVADLTDDWSHLRGLPTFDSLERAVSTLLKSLSK